MIKSVKKWHKLGRRALFVLVVFTGVVWLLFLVVAVFRQALKTPAVVMFRQYVLDPIPASVTNIKADQPKNILGYKYTFRFNINREDMDLLIDSRPFVKVWNVKYRKGFLGWGWDHAGPLGMSQRGQSMTLYHRHHWPWKPLWFRLKISDSSEVYVYYKVGDLENVEAFDRDMKKSNGRVETRVLIYNAKKSEAYFIVSAWHR